MTFIYCWFHFQRECLKTKFTLCDENHEYMDDFAQTSFLNSFKYLFFESERNFINFTAVKVLSAEIGENKKLMNIKMVKNKAYKCPQLHWLFFCWNCFKTSGSQTSDFKFFKNDNVKNLFCRIFILLLSDVI